MTFCAQALLGSLESNHRELVAERERRQRLLIQRDQLERVREQILYIRDIEHILNSGRLERFEDYFNGVVHFTSTYLNMYCIFKHIKVFLQYSYSYSNICDSLFKFMYFYISYSDGLLFERVALQLDRVLALNEAASQHAASATIIAVTNLCLCLF